MKGGKKESIEIRHYTMRSVEIEALDRRHWAMKEVKTEVLGMIRREGGTKELH